MKSPKFARSLRLWQVGLLAAVALAVVGFFTGTRGIPERGGYHHSVGGETASARAPKQRDMAEHRYGARRAAQEQAFSALRTPPRALTDSVALDADAYAHAVSERSLGRAYDGAPPTIPHAVDQRGAPACLTCHADGMRVDDKIARPLSHAPLSNCLQCHTTRSAGVPLREPLPHQVAEQTTFEGLARSGPGERAWPGAPPQMPHKSFMRERCTSCHGVWATGLASSHPYRQSCTQCHAPAASSEQIPRSRLSALGAVEQLP